MSMEVAKRKKRKVSSSLVHSDSVEYSLLFCSVLNLKLFFIFPIPNTMYCSMSELYRVTFLHAASVTS